MERIESTVEAVLGLGEVAMGVLREVEGVVAAAQGALEAEPDAALAREVDGAFVECDVKQEADAQAAAARGRVLPQPTGWGDPCSAEMGRSAA